MFFDSILRLTKKNSISESFWLLLSLVFAAIYSFLALKQAFAGDYIVQDDARQHVFWMLRYVDPELFPRDAIADYFQSVAPLGYSMIYRLVTYLNIDPLVFNKLLPSAISLITTYYCFTFCQQIFLPPPGCFVATILLNQSLWFKDDLVSATPRAFVYAFLLAFLYYLTKKSLLPCLLAIAGMGFFYPQYLFICAGLLIFQLIKRRNNYWRFSGSWQDNYVYLLGLVVACSILLFYGLSVSEYTPTITRTQALGLPEFHSGGRSSFFKENFWEYLFGGGRGGLFADNLMTPATLLMGLLLPILCRFPSQFPLVKQLNHHLRLLPQLIVVSVSMFGLAHILLFKLHLPSRYVNHSLLITLAIAAGISITVIWQMLLGQLQRRVSSRLSFKIVGEKILLMGLCIAIAISIIGYPSFVNKFPITKYKVGKASSLYQFLQKQPKDIMVASLTSETDNLPTFAQRSILVSREYAIPYHTGYYFPFRQLVSELIAAQYSTNLKTLQKLISKYQISFFLIEKSSFTSNYIENNSWLMSHQPVAQEAVKNLKKGDTPVMSTLQKQCSVFTEAELNLISAECILSH